jgi:hypothetical protein
MNDFSWREWRYASVDLANDVTTITAVPCLVKGAIVTTALSAQPCPIMDGTTPVYTLPASSAVGYTLMDEDGCRFETSLVVDPDNAATGVITVFYRILSQPW